MMLVLCMNIGSITTTSSASVCGKVLRLHVVANSDSERDQSLKYQVRDEMLRLSQGLFGKCEDVNTAFAAAKENKHLIEKAARNVLLKNGCDKDVKVVVGKELYPEKAYGDLVFPKGEYLSVRVLIGEGKGQNWWCVLFPPLCNVGVKDDTKVMADYGINEEEIEKLEEKDKEGSIEIFGCRIRLGIFDLFG